MFNKVGSGKNSSGIIENNNKVGYIEMIVFVFNRNIDRSGDRNVGGDSKIKVDSGFLDVNFVWVGKGGEVRKLLNEILGLSYVFCVY